jgi:hypothetical protein
MVMDACTMERGEMDYLMFLSVLQGVMTSRDRDRLLERSKRRPEGVLQALQKGDYNTTVGRHQVRISFYYRYKTSAGIGLV